MLPVEVCHLYISPGHNYFWARGQGAGCAGHLMITPDYFRAMKIPLLRGRAIDRRDIAQSPLVINEAFARKCFPGYNPIGEHVMIDRDENKAPPCEVIGMVGNSRHDSLAVAPSPEFYVPVTQRTREIGIRMALGAQMLSMVLRESLTLVLTGLGIGFVVALATTRLLRTLLYGVGANDDWITYFSVVVLLGGAALLASYVPPRRAMKVDSMVALRHE